MSARARTRPAVEAKGPAAYIAEAIGTFILVFAICGAVSASAGEGLELNLAGLGLVHAIALAVGIYTLGGTSGGHFNPAVTLALLTVGKIRGTDAAAYIVSQLVGALIAALVVVLLFNDVGDTVNYAAPAINDEVIPDGSPALGLLAEAIGTGILMWAIMGMAVNPLADRARAPRRGAVRKPRPVDVLDPPGRGGPRR